MAWWKNSVRGWLAGVVLAGAVVAVGACEPTQEAEVSPVEADGGVTPVGETADDLSYRGSKVVVETQTGEAGRFAEPCLITESSIAGIELGETLGGFAGAFPAGSALAFEPMWMVDFGSLCLLKEGRQHVCALFYEAEAEGWDPDLEMAGLFTLDPACRTASGVGPGTAIADAEAAFGPAEFQFNYENEGREYLSFADGSERWTFRASSEQGDEEAARGPESGAMWPHGNFGGDYRDGGDEFSTSVAMPDAVIWEVSIY